MCFFWESYQTHNTSSGGTAELLNVKATAVFWSIIFYHTTVIAAFQTIPEFLQSTAYKLRKYEHYFAHVSFPHQ